MKMKKATILMLCGSILLSGFMFPSCKTVQSMSNTAKGGVVGGTGGAAVGAGLGALLGKGKGAIIGGLLGAAVGTGAGVVIGNKMDKQKKELEQQLANEATVETVTDVNNLQAIKVTFDNGILFNTGKSDLSNNARASLQKFASSVESNPDTDITIYGHTDNTGSRQVNERISKERADAVSNFLVGNGISRTRITTEGLAYDQPVADNSTEAGRAQNRRVELYITANEQMVNDANAQAGN